MARNTPVEQPQRDGLSPIQQLADGERKPVDVTAIERELAILWKQSAEAGGSTAEPAASAVTRACVLNLIVVAPNVSAAAHAGDVIAHVASQDPCRAIVLTTVADDAPSLAAWVSAHCYLPQPGATQVCCEQVSIEARGDTLERAATLVLPLLASDLPVVVWWMGEPPAESGFFDRIVATANRVLIDSASFPTSPATLARVGWHLRDLDPSTAFVDLAWVRLTAWREEIAQCFDPPTIQPYISEVRRVEIDLGRAADDSPANQSEGLLLLGWIGSRLGWRVNPTTAPGSLVDWTLSEPDGQQVEVVLRTNESPEELGSGIQAVRLVAGRDSSISIKISRIARSELASDPRSCCQPGDGQSIGACVRTTVRVGDGAEVTRIGRVASISDEALMCQELEMTSRDEVFEQALELLDEIA